MARKSLATSDYIKHKIMSYLLFKKNCLGAFMEYINGSDVYGINPNFYGIEVEVKTRTDDFLSELKVIHNLYYPDYKVNNHQTSTNKISKHKSYLIKENPFFIRPKYFYFAIPEDMNDPTINLYGNAFGDSPYGLLVVRKRLVRPFEVWIEEVKKAEPLTDRKVDDPEMLMAMLRKVSIENFYLRGEALLYRKDRWD